jgi:hypothetical protein
MKSGNVNSDPVSSNLGQPSVIIALVLVLGAVIYLRYMHYIRRRTSQVLIAILLVALAVTGYEMYQSRF